MEASLNFRRSKFNLLVQTSQVPREEQSKELMAEPGQEYHSQFGFIYGSQSLHSIYSKQGKWNQSKLWCICNRQIIIQTEKNIIPTMPFLGVPTVPTIIVIIFNLLKMSVKCFSVFFIVLILVYCVRKCCFPSTKLILPINSQPEAILGQYAI